MDTSKVAATANQSTANYSIVRKNGDDTDVLSASGLLTANLLAAGIAPVVADRTFITAKRTGTFSTQSPGAHFASLPGSQGGTWGFDETGLLFTPNSSLPAGETSVTASFKITANGMTSANSATFTIQFLAKPADQTLSNLDRTAITTNAASATALACRVVLLDSATVSEMGVVTAQWSVNGKNIVFTPTGKTYQAKRAQMRYSLQSLDDRSLTEPATLTLEFSDPSAFPIDAGGSKTGRPNVAEISFLPYCAGVTDFQQAPLLYSDRAAAGSSTITVSSVADKSFTLVVQSSVNAVSGRRQIDVVAPSNPFPAGGTPVQFEFYYAVQASGQISNRAKITLTLS